MGELTVAVIGSDIQLYETRAIGACRVIIFLLVMPTFITSPKASKHANGENESEM